jgi:hypothetical protein
MMQDRIDAVWRQIQALKTRVAEERARLRTGDMASVAARPPPVSLKRSLQEPSLCLGRHSGRVTSLWWAAGGDQVIVASQDGRLTLWSLGSTGGGGSSGGSRAGGATAGATAGATSGGTPIPGNGTPSRANTIQLRSAWVMSVCLDGRWVGTAHCGMACCQVCCCWCRLLAGAGCCMWRTPLRPLH